MVIATYDRRECALVMSIGIAVCIAVGFVRLGLRFSVAFGLVGLSVCIFFLDTFCMPALCTFTAGRVCVYFILTVSVALA